MAKKGVIFNENAAGRIGVAVRHFENTYRDAPKAGVKKVIRGGGGCPPRNERWGIYMQGPPTGGTFALITTVNGVAESLSIAYNANAAAVKTAMEGHSEIAVDDVIVTGGPLPTTSIQIEFVENLAGKLVPVALANIASLTGSGIGVTVARLERGLPGDVTEAP